MLKGCAVLLALASIFPSTLSSNYQCVYQNSQLSVVDAYTSEEVRECVSTILVPGEYPAVRKLYVDSPQLTELKAGVFYGIRTFDLEINSQNLMRIENGIFEAVPQVQQSLNYLTINSNELTELNEAQWTDYINLWSFKLIGTKLTSISFAFLLGSNIRELYLYNTTHLTTIDRVEATIMGTYVFDNTGVSQLPQRMFEKNFVSSQRVTFKKNQNLKVLRAGVFEGGSMSLVVDFFDSPIEDIEPGFVDYKADGLVQIQLGGNTLGTIKKSVFEPIFRTWNNNNPRSNLIKWDVDGGRTSTPITCDCSINWLVSNPDYMKWVKNAVCTTGEPLEQVTFGPGVCFKCPSYSGLYPDPLDCGSFYQCSAYEEHHMSCPTGLVFNAAQGYCDWPYNTPPPCGTAA